jgi:L-threonylcarbamoyladenylate synthase
MKTVAIKRAAKVLTGGGTVVFPTETLYGLAAMATNKRAVGKVYAIKRRPREKLLPVIVGSFAQAQKYFIFSRVELAVARRFWPGPLTLVLKTRSKKLAAAVGGDRVAVRYSATTVAARLGQTYRASRDVLQSLRSSGSLVVLLVAVLPPRGLILTCF